MSGAASSDGDGDALTYSWSFGDGATASGATVSHAYSTGGSYNVRLIVTDTRGLADTVITTATILTPAQATTNAIAIVDGLLASGKLTSDRANSLRSKLGIAIRFFERGQDGVAINQLNAVLNELASLVSGGYLTADDAAPLRAMVERIIASASVT